LAELVRPAEFAQIKGVTRQTVATAMKSRIAAAVVERGGKKLLRRELALELWDRNTARNNNAVVGARGEPVKPAPVAPRPAAPPPGPAARVSDDDLAAFIRGLPEDQIPDLNESRARREHYQAEKARLEALQGRAELVPAADVKRQAFELARAVRDELSGIPDRVASMIAASSDVRQVHRMLSEEIRVALRGLSDG
jgi:hypothetical protein